MSVVQVWDQDGTIIATLPPEIDLNNVRDVRAQLLDGFQSSTAALIIDLSRSTYMDSKGIHVLMELEQHSQKSQRPLRLVVTPGDPLARLLDIAGVPIRRYESVALALEDILNTTSTPPK